MIPAWNGANQYKVKMCWIQPCSPIKSSQIVIKESVLKFEKKINQEIKKIKAHEKAGYRTKVELCLKLKSWLNSLK
jgi:hypothetical protein